MIEQRQVQLAPQGLGAERTLGIDQHAAVGTAAAGDADRVAEHAGGAALDLQLALGKKPVSPLVSVNTGIAGSTCNWLWVN